MNCLECDYGFIGYDDYEFIDEIIQCPICRTDYCVGYDESWDGENEECWFYLERVIP